MTPVLGCMLLTVNDVDRDDRVRVPIVRVILFEG